MYISTESSTQKQDSETNRLKEKEKRIDGERERNIP